MLTENIFESAVVTRDFENGLAGFRRAFVDARPLVIFPFVEPTTVLDEGGEGVCVCFLGEAVRWTRPR